MTFGELGQIFVDAGECLVAEPADLRHGRADSLSSLKVATSSGWLCRMRLNFAESRGSDCTVLVCILGPVEVRDGSTEVGLGGRRQRRVLTGLALGRGRSVSWEELETAAWGDEPPATARHTIATHVLRLRATGLVVSNTHPGTDWIHRPMPLSSRMRSKSARRLIGSDPHIRSSGSVMRSRSARPSAARA